MNGDMRMRHGGHEIEENTQQPPASKEVRLLVRK